MKVKKKKKKKKNRSALKKKGNKGSVAGDTETNLDDATSFMTMTVADMKENEDFMISLIDDVKLV